LLDTCFSGSVLTLDDRGDDVWFWYNGNVVLEVEGVGSMNALANDGWS
jgi:hypothetical protein